PATACVSTAPLHDALPIYMMSETTVTTQSMEVNAEEVAKQLLAINQAAESLHEILVKADQTRAAAEDMTNIAAELTKHSQRLERSEEHTSELQSRENLVCR